MISIRNLTLKNEKLPPQQSDITIEPDGRIHISFLWDDLRDLPDRINNIEGIAATLENSATRAWTSPKNIVPRSRIPVVDAHTKKFRIDASSCDVPSYLINKASLTYTDKVKDVQSVYDKDSYGLFLSSHDHRFMFVGADDQAYGMKCHDERDPHNERVIDGYSYQAIENPVPRRIKRLSCHDQRNLRDIGVCTAMHIESEELVGWVWDYERETLQNLTVPNDFGKILKTVTSAYVSCVITKDALEAKCWSYSPSANQQAVNKSVEHVQMGGAPCDGFSCECCSRPA